MYGLFEIDFIYISGHFLKHYCNQIIFYLACMMQRLESILLPVQSLIVFIAEEWNYEMPCWLMSQPMEMALCLTRWMAKLSTRVS
jgi:hypothetical protein